MVNPKRGFALFTALILLLVIMAVLALLAASLTRQQMLYRQENQAMHLGALTDAGVALALAELTNNPAWTGTDDTVLLDRGQFDARITDVASNRRTVRIDAFWGARGRSVEVELALQQGRVRVTTWRRVD
ncbi:MAG: hypothetical protein AAGD38_12170 [Acidobacteriota bacterium]